MKLRSLFCSAEFCILKLILHKIMTSSFEEQEKQGNNATWGSQVRPEVQESWQRGTCAVGKDGGRSAFPSWKVSQDSEDQLATFL